MHRRGRAGPGYERRAGRWLHRLRLHRRQPACRQPRADHAAAADAAARPPARGADGRRHHPHRRPVRQGRSPADAVRRAHRRQHGRHTPLHRTLRALRRRPLRRSHAEQRGLAGPAGLHRPAARRGAALHHRPHADLRQRAPAPRPRAAADVPRIQLHDPAKLRLPRAGPAPWRSAANGRVGPMGQHRLGRRAGAADRGSAGVRSDDAADHDGRRRQDGQDGARRGVAGCGPAGAL